MKIITYECPECGATLNLPKGVDSGKCKYCGNVFVVDDENRTFTYNKNIKIEKNSTHTEHYIDEAEVVRAKKEVSDNKTIIILVLLILISLAMLWFMPDSSDTNREEAIEKGMISGGYYDDYLDENYEVVVAHLEAAGFTNIKLVDLNDSGIQFWKADEVESVSIGGNLHFYSDDYFSPDTQVVISYH